MNDLTPKQKRVLKAMKEHLKDGSLNILSEASGVSKTGVAKAARRLAELGYIVFERTHRFYELTDKAR